MTQRSGQSSELRFIGTDDNSDADNQASVLDLVEDWMMA